jgi:hypothetical protein
VVFREIIDQDRTPDRSSLIHVGLGSRCSSVTARLRDTASYSQRE